MNIFIGLLALLGGIAASIQARIMGNVESKLNIGGAISINFIIGSIFLFGLFLIFCISDFFNKRNFNFNLWLNKAYELEWWELTSGLFGIVIVGVLGVSTSRVGIVITLSFFIVGQLITAIFLDHFGFLGGAIHTVNLNKVLAIIFLLIGLCFFLKN